MVERFNYRLNQSDNKNTSWWIQILVSRSNGGDQVSPTNPTVLVSLDRWLGNPSMRFDHGCHLTTLSLPPHVLSTTRLVAPQWPPREWPQAPAPSSRHRFGGLELRHCVKLMPPDPNSSTEPQIYHVIELKQGCGIELELYYGVENKLVLHAGCDQRALGREGEKEDGEGWRGLAACRKRLCHWRRRQRGSKAAVLAQEFADIRQEI